jgi:glycosyltransferase involved in cell wall biosynthesis
MRIGLVSEVDVTRPRSWSGTTYFMGEALAGAGASVERLEPVWRRRTRALSRAGHALRRLGVADPMLNRTGAAAALKARALSRMVERSGLDAVFAPVGSTLVARYDAAPPLLYASDATVVGMTGYYPEFTDLPPALLERIMREEREALHRAALLLYPTWWAARDVVGAYGVPEERVLVQPFGANILEAPPREAALAPREPGPWRLLLCGVDWERKGGDTAVGALEALRARGLEATLTVMGVVPPEAVTERVAGIEVIPFLDKFDEEGAREFGRVFARADLLVLPTRADCYGMVFCEAAAYGTPSVASATGGTSEAIAEGVTGHTLPLEAGARDWADLLERLLTEPGRLEALRRSARGDFEARLDWAVWGRAVTERLGAILARRRGEGA